ncbi:MAG: hypothetical protein PHV32_02545 [Eubacteriales bacterium]|nr:hypothetical protein [Eubacteriales bacterium]
MGAREKRQLPEEQTFIFLQIIDSLPYPLAIFDRSLTVTMVNKAFENAANICCDYPPTGALRILPDRIEDPQLAASFMKVFNGDTIFLEGMKSPFAMFSGIEERKIVLPDCIYRVEVSPVPAEDKKVTHGVIMYMQKNLNSER